MSAKKNNKVFAYLADAAVVEKEKEDEEHEDHKEHEDHEEHEEHKEDEEHENHVVYEEDGLLGYIYFDDETITLEQFVKRLQSILHANPELGSMRTLRGEFGAAEEIGVLEINKKRGWVVLG